MMQNCFRKSRVLILALCLCALVPLSACKRGVPTYDRERGAIEAEDCQISGAKVSKDERYSQGKAVSVSEADQSKVAFTYQADQRGYFDFSISYCNDQADGTLGLFVNDRFYKKVLFPQGQGKLTETIFLDTGSNSIRFTYLPGDSNINLDQFSVDPSSRHISMIVAPHEDDEILAFGGTIQQILKRGDIVKVVMLTNGDYYGQEISSIRFQETIRALEHVGVSAADITFLGYGDLTLYALHEAEDENKVFQGRGGAYMTYGDYANNIYDYHFLNTGDVADCCRRNFIADLRSVIEVTRPDEIYTVSEFEWHTDHQFAWIMLNEVVELIQKDMDYHPVLFQSVIHGEETTWPARLEYNEDGTFVIESFTEPFPTMETTLDWEKVTRIELTDEEVRRKKEAISEYATQNDGWNGSPGNAEYDYAFCKRDEFYWRFEC